MRWMMAAMLMLFVSGCNSTPANGPAICDGTEKSRASLAAALVVDGGPVSQRAGLLVLDQMTAGCGRPN